MRHFIIIAVFLLPALLFFTGCSPQERAGVNPKPFNTPSDWENRPYGDRTQN